MTSANSVGLALSGGALKAAAHVGVLKGLDDLGVKPAFVAGTSAGSFIAALYAFGYTPDDMMELIQCFPGPLLFDYGFPLLSSLGSWWWYRTHRYGRRHPRLPGGLLKGNRLLKYMTATFRNRTPIMPYYIIAADLLSGQPVVMSNDLRMVKRSRAVPVKDVALCVRGSCSLPGVMTPVPLQNRLLVDGGIRDYVPVSVLRDAGCDKVIAANVYHLADDWTPETFVHVLSRSLDILLQETVDMDIDGSALVLAPNVEHVSWLSFDQMMKCVEAGATAVKQHEKDILNYLAAPPATRTKTKPVTYVGAKRIP